MASAQSRDEDCNKRHHDFSLQRLSAKVRHLNALLTPQPSPAIILKEDDDDVQ
ncbi:hypothetical protein ENH_00035930, partial [Eimeria necatrix]